MSLTFPSGSTDDTMRCLDVTIEDDTALEEEETFTVTLTTENTAVTLDNDETEVTILDNDGLLLTEALRYY